MDGTGDEFFDFPVLHTSLLVLTPMSLVCNKNVFVFHINFRNAICSIKTYVMDSFSIRLEVEDVECVPLSYYGVWYDCPHALQLISTTCFDEPLIFLSIDTYFTISVFFENPISDS